MRILFLSPRQCWPPESGAKLREFYLASALGTRTELTHVFFSPPGSTPPGPADLAHARKILAVSQPPAYSAGRIVRGLFSRWPLPILNYTSAAMSDALAALLIESRFDLIHLDSIHMAAYVPLLARYSAAPMTYDWHNIESELMSRYSEHVPSPARRTYAALTARRLAAVENRILREAFGHIVCSERERSALLDRVPGARIAVIENGVDVSFFAQTGAAAARRRIVFVGSMSYHANADAVVLFARTVWPAIRRQLPQSVLTIVGSNPTPAVQALHGIENVEVTGTVPDVRPYYAEAAAAIVPLRIGGGTRLKILEAMAAGVPVISSTPGAEGLAVSPGRDILIADRNDDWLAHLQALDRDPALRLELVEAGRRLAAARYDWPLLGKALFDTYSNWLKIPTC